MSNNKWGCIVRQCDDGNWLVTDATRSFWLSFDGVWNLCSRQPEPWFIGSCTTEDVAIRSLASATIPPPTYTAPHVEVKPDPWPSMMAKVSDAMNRLCDAAEQMKKERDAARAEIARMKEEGK